MEDYRIYELELDRPMGIKVSKLPPMNDIRHRFVPIDQLFTDLNVDATNWIDSLGRYHDLAETRRDLEEAANRWTAMYGNVTKRLDSFTFLFIGACNAGKTSLILDLLGHSSPDALNAMLYQRYPDFDPEHEIRVGKEVTTKAIYDFHLKNLGLRIIDAPGNGGVIHANPTLGPYVDLADCVIYVLSAVTNITANDVEFLTRHVANADADRAFQLQPGRDKTVILVWNRWLTEYEKQPAEVVDGAWRRITEWTIHGIPGTFAGLAGVFSAPPLVIKTNSRRRRTDTGELLPDEQLYIEELGQLITDTSAREGTALRLKRPLQLLSRHLGEVENTLRHRRLAMLPSGEEVFKPVVEDMNRRSAVVRTEVHNRLRRLGAQIKPPLVQAFEAAVAAWQPPPTFLKSLKALVPFARWGCGVDAVTKEISTSWAESFRGQFLKAIEERSIPSLIESTHEQLLSFITSESIPDLSTLPEADLERVSRKIHELLQRSSTGSANPREHDRFAAESTSSGQSTFRELNDQMSRLVKNCVQSAVKEQIGILAGGAVIDLILAKFTLGLSVVVAGVVRWLRSGKQERAAQTQFQREGANAIQSVVNAMTEDLIAAHDTIRGKVESLILQVLDGESEIKDQRRHVLLTIIDEIAAFENRVTREYESKLEEAAV